MPPNVNFFELENCLDDLIPFADKHARKDYVQRNRTRLERTREALHEQVAITDTTYTAWRMEDGEEKLALKHLQRAHKRAQNLLRDAGAIGYPDERVDYWDEAIIREAAAELLAYLREHRGALDFAGELIDELSRLLENSGRELRETTQALNAYRKVSAQRKIAMELAIDIIDDMRRAVRDDLGRGHADYKAIRWPAMVAPDPF